MNYNYHTHTRRCRHATGEAEEYVLRAIEGGIKYMGFSEHIPLLFDDKTESFYRLLMDESDEYVEEISHLKEKYKDQIEIKMGFEMEYYPRFFDAMLNTAKRLGGEYLILGQHYIQKGEHDGPYVLVPREDEELLEEYANLVVEAMKTGVFTYVAHPDIFNFTGDDKTYEKHMEKICIASKELDIPLELNFLGIRGKRNYPNEKFWCIAGKVGSPITFGFDSHDVEGAYDGKSLSVAQEIVEKYKLNYIGKPTLKK